MFLLLEIESVTALLAGRATWEVKAKEKANLPRICKVSNEFGEFLVPGQKYVPFLVAWKVTCLCVVQYLMVWVFFKCSASVTSFILMIWNSHSLVNIARGCLPQKVWIYSCWRQGWKAGYCSSVFKSCVRPWASATPDAGGRTLSWVCSMQNRSVPKRKGGHLFLWREGCFLRREFASLCPSSSFWQVLGTQPLAAPSAAWPSAKGYQHLPAHI